jgi:hypothetical protein
MPIELTYIRPILITLASTRFNELPENSPLFDIPLNQIFVQLIFESHPQAAKNLLQLVVQGVELLENVVLPLLQFVEQLTGFEIRYLRCLYWRHVC